MPRPTRFNNAPPVANPNQAAADQEVKIINQPNDDIEGALFRSGDLKILPNGTPEFWDRSSSDIDGVAALNALSRDVQVGMLAIPPARGPLTPEEKRGVDYMKNFGAYMSGEAEVDVAALHAADPSLPPGDPYVMRLKDLEVVAKRKSDAYNKPTSTKTPAEQRQAQREYDAVNRLIEEFEVNGYDTNPANRPKVADAYMALVAAGTSPTDPAFIAAEAALQEQDGRNKDEAIVYSLFAQQPAYKRPVPAGLPTAAPTTTAPGATAPATAPAAPTPAPVAAPATINRLSPTTDKAAIAKERLAAATDGLALWNAKRAGRLMPFLSATTRRKYESAKREFDRAVRQSARYEISDIIDNEDAEGNPLGLTAGEQNSQVVRHILGKYGEVRDKTVAYMGSEDVKGWTQKSAEWINRNKKKVMLGIGVIAIASGVGIIAGAAMAVGVRTAAQYQATSYRSYIDGAKNTLNEVDAKIAGQNALIDRGVNIGGNGDKAIAIRALMAGSRDLREQIENQIRREALTRYGVSGFLGALAGGATYGVGSAGAHIFQSMMPNFSLTGHSLDHLYNGASADILTPEQFQRVHDLHTRGLI